MKDIDKQKLIEMIETYAILYRHYMVALSEQSSNYKVWQGMVDEKLDFIKKHLDSVQLS